MRRKNDERAVRPLTTALSRFLSLARARPLSPQTQPLPPKNSRLLVTGDPKTGYDLGSIASLGLTAWAGPAAKRSGDALMAGMAALGAVSSAGNLVKSYEMRTGRPRELEMRHR
jgi:hypothetical protein